MTSAALSFVEMRQAIKEGRLTITTGKDICKGATPNNNVHHAYALERQDGTSSESFNFTFPPLLFSHITKQIPKDSKYASYFVHGDVYGKWPLGKNRGEDPKGDELFDFFMELERSYCYSLTNDVETKNMIFLHTDQEPIVRGERKYVTDIMTLINPIIQYPLFREGHPQEKQRDESKSPTFKIKLWDAKINEKNRSQIRNDSLLVNVDPLADLHGNPNDPSRYLQMIYTKIYDLRQQRNAMSDTYITKEAILDEFVYMAGDSTKGKSPCILLATMTVLAPSWYWEAKKGASIQFKASTMEIFRKTILRRTNARTPEVKINRYQEAMAAIADYGLDQLDEDDGDGDYDVDEGELSCNRQQNNSGNSNQQHGGQRFQNNGGGQRQINPGAVVAVRHKTNPVCVYPSESSVTESMTTGSDTTARNDEGSSGGTANSSGFNFPHGGIDSPRRSPSRTDEPWTRNVNFNHEDDVRSTFADEQSKGSDQEDEEITDNTAGSTKKRSGHHNHRGGSFSANKKQKYSK